MALFDINTITNPGYNWFSGKLDPNFSIPDDNRSKVIFGFNGIGKTSIFRCIQESNNPDIEFIEYGELKFQLVKGKDTIVISPNINLITKLKSQIEPLMPSLNTNKNLKDTFGFSKKEDIKAFGPRIQIAWKDKSFSGFVKPKSSIQSIEATIPGIPPKILITSIPEISAVINAQHELQKAKDHALFHVLNDLDNITEASDVVCPICGNSAPNLKAIIQTKKNALSNIQSVLIEKLKQANITADSVLIKNLVSVVNQMNADADLKADYLLCGGSSSNFDTIQNNHTMFQGLNAQLQPLVTVAQTSYANILNVKDSLEIDLNRYFSVTPANVSYDNSSFTITIKFPREIKTYSTGEMNLLGFLYKVYSFIGSDKTTLLLDDPVSSLDLINHYKIAYEIVKSSSSRTMIVLTHSIELINVINSQRPRQFDFYYLEEAGGVISIQAIPYLPSTSNPNLITLDRLADVPSFQGFKEALMRRETESYSAPIQRLFHHTIAAEHLDGDLSKFSNHTLAALIDNFTNFTKADFYADSYIKILYLCALRIWLEKKLYSLIPSRNTSLQNLYLSKDTLGEKIDCLLPRTGPAQITVPVGLTRDILMSKKVMLNQGVHYNSQVMPFAYAINLSLDMLRDEIIEFKTILP